MGRYKLIIMANTYTQIHIQAVFTVQKQRMPHSKQLAGGYP